MGLIPDCPIFDYARWPNQPLNGIRGGSVTPLTRALFWETAQDTPETWRHVRYTLEENAVYVPQLEKWLPAACQIYTHSIDEYQAMRRLVGSSQQWNILIALDWFTPFLEVWKAEQDHIQYVFLRESLLDEVEAGTKSAVSAAKTLLDLRIKKGKVGRPARKRDNAESPIDAATAADIARLEGVGLRSVK